MLQENKPKILCVDDEKLNLKLLQSLFMPEGYEFQGAESGEIALGQVAQDPPDVILLDIMMPKMSGFEVLQKLRADEKTRLIPVVMLTALKETEDRVKALEAGCDDFISKPFDKIELFARIKSLLRISYYRSLLDEKEKFEYILNQIEEGIIVFDKDLKVIKSNETARRLLFLDTGEETSDFLKHINKLFKIHYAGDLPFDIKKQGVCFDLQREETKKVKPLIIEAHSNVIKNPLGEISDITLLIRDVTKARIEEELKQNFLDLISHKLRTPLTIILGGLDCIRDAVVGSLKEEEQKIFFSVRENGLKLLGLITRLLHFTTINTSRLDLPKEEIILSEYIPRITEPFLNLEAKKKVNIGINLEDEGLKIQMNRIYFDLIMNNLIENAIKFNDKEEVNITISAKRLIDKIHILVEDNGRGIPAEEEDKIFQKFYQVEKYFTGNVEGAGLGLAVVKQIIIGHGGGIQVKSEISKGTTFILGFPNA